MNAVVQAILPFILLYKYWALFGITFIAALVLPIPPGALLMASSAFASDGYLNFWLVIIVASAGNILGDNLGYWLSKKYGKKILSQIGFRKIFESQKYHSIEKRLRDEPGWIIFISRFEVVSNLTVNIISGISNVPYRRYLTFEALGEILQVLLYCGIGYVFGDAWQAVDSIIGRFLVIILLIAIALAIIFWKRIGRWLYKKE